MIKKIRTQSGTEIVEGIEYNAYPAPGCLIKVMKRYLAERLLSEGAIRFGNLDYYRRLENDLLGDRNEGKGMFSMNGHPYKVDSGNPVYVWCAALPTITPQRVNLLANHGCYDCVVRIHKPEKLIHHLRLAKDRHFHMHCAEISYNRGTEVDKEALDSQMFHFNVFQKDARFSEDQEYRISLTDLRRTPEPVSHIDLSIGECPDIMVIEELPNIGI